MNVGSPNRTNRPMGAEGGGDVRSTLDIRDNITRKEGRDIGSTKKNKEMPNHNNYNIWGVITEVVASQAHRNCHFESEARR